jgi:hypothetical protein
MLSPNDLRALPFFNSLDCASHQFSFLVCDGKSIMAPTHGDVSGSVLSIIAAFRSGLDIFNRVRRRDKKTKKRHVSQHRNSTEELQLGKSLRRGPSAIRRHYETSLEALGAPFAAGDGMLPYSSLVSPCWSQSWVLTHQSKQ